MKTYILIATSLFLSQSLLAGNYCDPDSLTTVTKTGEAIVQITGNKAHYYLDEDYDGTADYNLNFGPHWYTPDTGSATLPGDGDTITIVGGLNTTNSSPTSVIVVYEIDGEYWRTPYEPFWNEFNNNYSGQGGNPGNEYCPGWFQNNLMLTTFTGMLSVDSTFIFLRYFLDTDYDGAIDYKLNFGPPWYTPTVNVPLPDEGDTVTVLGGLIQLNNLPVIIVFELDGLVWRDSTGYGGHRGGRWMHSSMSSNFSAHEFFDNSNRIQFMHGWHHGPLPANMFCQIIQVHAQNQPMYQNQNGFAGFQCGFFDSSSTNLMAQNNNRFVFNSNAQVQFHFTQGQLSRAGIQIHDRDRIRLKAWDHVGQAWRDVTGAVVDTQNNLVSFSSDTIAAFYILTKADDGTAISEIENEGDNDNIFVYPNPGDSHINLNFESQGGSTSIVVYNVMGKVVATPIDEVVTSPGKHNLSLNTASFSAGIYYLRLVKGESIASKAFIINH